ncbi:GxxExxY protein [Sphingomonas sp. 7/4-4]|uniref:GxxExxY protein n=1 Tax=Sphingomonas sp. 7/4-4 TaxID=3018446 RepID=UPI00300DDCFA
MAQQRPIDIEYDGLRFQAAFRADLIVNGCVLVEVKSVERLTAVHGKQVLTYLRLLKQPLGLLINFGGETLKEGLRRIVNDYKPLAPSRLRVNQ